MAVKRTSDIEFLQILKDFNKSSFTVADFEKILKMERNVLYVALNRFVKSGVLIRLKKGVYTPEFQSLDLGKTANELYYPSYLSFESALSRYGVLSQIPYTLTFATTRITKKLNLAGREIEYRKLKNELFFGFILTNGVYIAEPEKAVLDELYLISKGRAASEINEWSFVGLDKEKFLDYSQKFPLTVQKKAKELFARLDERVVTIDKTETSGG